MSDADLRCLERAALADPAQRPAWLAARLRAGELSRERLELAAYCGDETARALASLKVVYRVTVLGGASKGTAATGSLWRWEVADKQDLHTWARGLGTWGHEVQVRAGLAAALEAFGDPSATRPCFCGVDGVRCESCLTLRAVDSVRAWLGDPGEENRKVCQEFTRHDLHLPGWIDGVLMAIAGSFRPEHRSGRIQCSVEDAAQATSEQAVREAMQRELIAWALGTPGRAS